MCWYPRAYQVIMEAPFSTVTSIRDAAEEGTVTSSDVVNVPVVEPVIILRADHPGGNTSNASIE